MVERSDEKLGAELPTEFSSPPADLLEGIAALQREVRGQLQGWDRLLQAARQMELGASALRLVQRNVSPCSTCGYLP